MNEATKTAPKIDTAAAFRLWIGILIPPAAALTQLQLLYLASEYGCATSNFTKNHVIALGALLVSLLALAIAWHEWTKTRTDDPVVNREGHGRSRFMALIGVMSGFLFSMLSIALWLPTLVGVPCDK